MWAGLIQTNPYVPFLGTNELTRCYKVVIIVTVVYRNPSFFDVGQVYHLAKVNNRGNFRFLILFIRFRCNLLIISVALFMPRGHFVCEN